MRKIISKIAGTLLGLSLSFSLGFSIANKTNKNLAVLAGSESFNFDLSKFNGQGAASPGAEMSASDHNVTVVFSNGNYSSSTDVRDYAGGTISLSGATITSISITATAADKNGGNWTPSAGDVNVSQASISWSGSASSLSLGHTAQVRVKTLSITIETDSGALSTPSPIFDENQSRITWDSDENADHYEVSSDGGETWTNATASTYHDVSSFSSGVLHTLSVKAVASPLDTEHTDSSAASVKFAFLAHSGESTDPYTVQDARLALDAELEVEGRYVGGIVSEIVTAYSSTHKNITFNIVDNASDETFLQAYRCGGEEAENIAEGDIVQVSGNLIIYGTTYELAQGCVLESRTPAPTVEYTISYDANGGKGTMEPTIGSAPVVADCTFTRDDDKVFLRWNDESDGSGDDYAVGASVSKDLTLFAIWGNAPLDPSTYFTKIESTADIKDGKYVIVSNGIIFNGALETLDVTHNIESMTPEKLLASYFTLSVSDETIVSASGFYIGNNSDSNSLSSSKTTVFTNTISIDTDGNLVVRSSGGAYLRYNSASDQDRFRYYKSSSYTAQQTIQLYKINFAEVILSMVECNDLGLTEPSGTSWSTLELYYNTLSTSEKADLVDVEASKTGSRLEQAMAKYDYIVGKYNKTLGMTEKYKDFINRDPLPVAGSNLGLVSNRVGETSTIIIVVVALTSITSIGVLLVIKRKRSLVK